jgi:endoglucanase
LVIIPSPRRPLRTAAVAALTGLAASVAWLAVGTTPAAALTGSLYRDPNSQVIRWITANPNDSRVATIRDKVASQPAAHWLSAFSPSTVTSEVSGLVGDANAAGQVPLLSVYEIPNRDCGGASAGGASNLTQYQQWISSMSQGLGNRMVIIVLETDSLALQTCLSSSDIQARDNALSTAVQTIKAANANAKVYLDGGHSAWNSATDQGARLAAAGIRFADGFFTNVSNFQPLSNEASYGRAIMSYLQSVGITGKHQIIDTSRNGGAAGDWCADDNTDRVLGTYPTLTTGDANIDGYLWVKPPGEADGCAFTAGMFIPDLAFSLAQRAPNPPGNTTPPTTTPPTTTPPTTTPPTTTPPTTTPPVTTTPPTTTPPSSGGACTATFQITNSWQGNFQAAVTVTAGNSAITHWTVTWTLSSGQAITQLWNGAATTSGQTETVTNVSYNGALAAHANTQFGFTASGPATPPSTVNCTAS